MLGAGTRLGPHEIIGPLGAASDIVLFDVAK